MHLVRVVQRDSVDVHPSAPLRYALGREDKNPQMLLVVGRLCIYLMEISFYYKPLWRIRTSAEPSGLWLSVCDVSLDRLCVCFFSFTFSLHSSQLSLLYEPFQVHSKLLYHLNHLRKKRSYTTSLTARISVSKSHFIGHKIWHPIYLDTLGRLIFFHYLWVKGPWIVFLT